MKLNEVKRQVIKEDFKPGDRVRFTSPRNATEDGVVVRTLDSSATEVKFDSGEKRGVFTTSLTLLKEAKDIRLLERQLIAIEKKMSAKDDPCWKGYHMVGTKNKNGREVPNCVPGKKGVAEGLNEFAPAGGGGNIPRGPKTPNRGPWDDSGEDPYQLRRYNRSADFFDQFDSEGVDKQKFDKATGEYEGYYFDRDSASGITQIAYFKFDNPAKIGDNDPGMGWYYEPVDEGVAEGAEFGSNYAEQLAQKVFDTNPSIDNEDAILNAGYAIAKKTMGSRANGIFRNEDFPSDFVSAYFYLKKQGVAEGSDDLRDSVSDVLKTIYKGASAGENMIDYLADEFGQYYSEVEASGDQSLQNAYGYMMDNGQEAEDDPQAMAKIAKQALFILKQGVAEGSEHDQSHGSPYDRGAADSYYHRPRRPHKGGVGGSSGEESTNLTPEEIKAYHAGYDWNERHGDKKIWDSKDNNQSVSEADEPGDVRTKFALQKARGQFPMAKSDAEALALYINRKEQKDVDELGAENDYEDMMIDQLSKFDDKIDQEVDELQRQIDQLKRHAGIKSEAVVEGSAENMIKHVKDARAFMNSGQPEPKSINRAGYNTINSKDEWLEKIRVMQQVQNDPGLKNDAEAQEAIRQRIGDLNRVGLEKGWA